MSYASRKVIFPDALIPKFVCIWISYVRDGHPISGYGLHSFPAYRSQLEESFNEAPEISLYGCLA